MPSAKVLAMLPGPIMPQRISFVSFMICPPWDFLTGFALGVGAAGLDRRILTEAEWRSWVQRNFRSRARLRPIFNGFVAGIVEQEDVACPDGDRESVAIAFIAGFLAFDDDLFAAAHIGVDVAGIAKMFGDIDLDRSDLHRRWPALKKCSGRMPSVTFCADYDGFEIFNRQGQIGTFP